MASASPDMFVVAFVGQTLVAMSQVFILSVPARLAAVWFGPNEVSSACSIGVFGNQVSSCGLRVSPVSPGLDWHSYPLSSHIKLVASNSDSLP